MAIIPLLLIGIIFIGKIKTSMGFGLFAMDYEEINKKGERKPTLIWDTTFGQD